MDYFGDGSRLGVKIEYFVEETPLGNAGALYKLRDRIGTEPFLLLNADAVFDVDFNRMVEYHKAHNALVTLFTHPNSHPYDSGLTIANEENRVQVWLAKEDELDEIHKKLEIELGYAGAYVDGLYYCPHHPHKGYEGEIVELKIDCDCRKPKSGMLFKAAEEFNINLSNSFMIGDGENDVKAGLAAGCKSILINGEGTDSKTGVDTVASVAEFVEKYL